MNLEEYYVKLKKDTEQGGYLLNQDKEFVIMLIEGLLKNEERYGYQSCPCRLATGKKENDLDIICPCDYRDADLNQFGQCYCALYVSQDYINGKFPKGSIPERRSPEKILGKVEVKKMESSGIVVWRCKVCGYLCARENPPEVCPVCKAKKERFEVFNVVLKGG